MSDDMRFGFGQNWKDYLSKAEDEHFERADRELYEWLSPEEIAGKRVIDIGSGSGIHSWAFHKAGAAELVSFDYDQDSVDATAYLRERAGEPENWQVMQGSVLDKPFLEKLGSFDIVYSWGVLHHTGSMWEAIENAYAMVKPGGQVMIALYKAGPRYEADLELKRRYNQADEAGKRAMEKDWIRGIMKERLLSGKNPFNWNQTKERGMNVYYDIVDWLGGYPYEVASERETILHARKFGFVLEKIEIRWEGSINTFLFSVP